ncbi:MAG: adenylosuccinate lyase [Phycisphaerae bacterium SM23_30]|nr:MAG: adenylosuccinate lyase [Phycisphaerae bacterium SM23_30]
MSKKTSKIYENPLISRYASPQMLEVFSPQFKFGTWRRLWLALAESQAELGLPIKKKQLAEMRRHLDDIDFDRSTKYEKKYRHDVMAHVHTFADAAPSAGPIIHLGATSAFVGDNTDLIQMRKGLELIRARLLRVINLLADFARKYKKLATLGYTHFQPAQLTTVGKRATLWCYDFVLDLEEIQYRLDTLCFRGVKGATGTQASFLRLFEGDHSKVRFLDKLVAQKMGFDKVAPVTGQTYSRKIDAQVLAALTGVAQTAHKLSNDLRLLANLKQIEEPFEKDQIGSSAMAYKRNPMRCERVASLARYVISLSTSPMMTAAGQWFERTLDDSANKRLVIPEAFLAADAILVILANVLDGLVVYRQVISAAVKAELPFIATEDILMAAVKAGGNRQKLHGIIRKHSLAAAEQVKLHGRKNDLIRRLQKEPAFKKVDFNALLKPRLYVGRAPRQVDEFLRKTVDHIRRKYRKVADVKDVELKV